MKIWMYSVVSILVALLFLQPVPAHAQFDKFLKSVQETLLKQELSEEDIARGLKEALRVGTGKAVDIVSVVNGYYENPDIKIPLPDNVSQLENLLRTMGMGGQVDAFLLSMNRAAERAAPQARDIFLDAVTEMTFPDAKRILEGRDNEATLYFREKTGDRLTSAFTPIVHDAMADVGVTRIYQDLDKKMKTIPFADHYRFDLDQYVTGKALDGLFFMLAAEERKIREDPQARVTEILRKVFGKK
ncbi:hypothetical protein D3OALGA1CA_5288 [Olavius algarvensis associated proteobacterium Delta 3]|nr:hypothetical protein D3OALGA1CA_5288 [Olavius algarvensis associated proteobacterium Delta 3]